MVYVLVSKILLHFKHKKKKTVKVGFFEDSKLSI